MRKIFLMLVLLFTIFFSACSKGRVWDLNQPFVISTAWNLPNSELYVNGLTSAINQFGGIVVEGGGPSSSMYAPPNTQEIHIFDDNKPPCDPADLNIIAYAVNGEIHVCHNFAVIQNVLIDHTKIPFSVNITMMHEFDHLGGNGWHWLASDVEKSAVPMRVMASVRKQELVTAYTIYDLDYGCTGGLFIGGICDGWTPLPIEENIQRVIGTGN